MPCNQTGDPRLPFIRVGKAIHHTDGSSLLGMARQDEAHQLSLALQPYQFQIHYQAGKASANADALSRRFSTGATNAFVAGEGGWSVRD